MDRRNCWSRGAARTLFVCAATLALSAGVANAQDAAKKNAEGAKKGGERDDAVKTMPKWESFGAGEETGMEETFFRLAQDFVSTSEVGYRRLGEVPIWPRGELKVGKFRVLPYLREAGEWNTNTFRRNETADPEGDNNGREASFTQVTTLGALADTTLMGGRLRLALSVESEWQNRNSRKNGADTWQFDSQLGATYRWPSGLWVTGGVAWERRADPVEIEFAGSQFQRTNRRSFFSAGMDKDILFGSKARVEVGVSLRDTGARGTEFDSADHTLAEWYLKASYPFWKDTTRVFGRMRYRQEEREFDATNDGNVYGFDFGIEGSVPFYDNGYRGLRGSLSVGFDRGVYENDTFNRSGPASIRDDSSRETNVAVQAALQYLQSPRQTWDLRYLRTQQFSARGVNFQITDRVDLILSRTLARQLVGRLSLFWEHSDPSGVEPAERLDGSFTGSAPTRNITRGGIGAGLRYAIQDWVDVDVSWDYSRRNGAGQGDSFSNHRALIGLTFYLQAIKPPTFGPRQP